MTGGPLPKPPGQAARKNPPRMPLRTISVKRAPQPKLPTDWEWHPRTLEWWVMWDKTPLSYDFTTADWSELMDTAVIHSKFWNGDTKVAPELRQRTAKFGATPEDRARLRIVFAVANDKEDKRGSRVPSSREQHPELRLEDTA